MNKADSLWAWVTAYPDGSIGLIGSMALIDGVMMPLIGRNEAAIRKVEPIARRHGAVSKQRVWLRRYDFAKDYADD